jgi:hypothetical protein
VVVYVHVVGHMPRCIHRETTHTMELIMGIHNQIFSTCLMSQVLVYYIRCRWDCREKVEEEEDYNRLIISCCYEVKGGDGGECVYCLF